MKTKLITGRYKGYEVCYANKGQIFPRDGWYLTKGDDVIYIEDAIAQTREETIREVEERESIKLVHEKAFNCPTLSIQCNHDFKFSHTEEENKIGSVGTTTGTMPPRLFDVVVCSKCGEIRKSLKYLTN